MQNTHTTVTVMKKREPETKALTTRISYFAFHISASRQSISEHYLYTKYYIQTTILNTNIILFNHSFGGLSPPNSAQG